MNAPVLRSTLVTASFGIFFWGVGWGGDLCILFQRFSGHKFFPKEILRNLQFLTDKTWKFCPGPTPSSPFLVFNLLVKPTVAIREVCQRVYRDVRVYIVCMLTLLKDTF